MTRFYVKTTELSRKLKGRALRNTEVGLRLVRRLPVEIVVSAKPIDAMAFRLEIEATDRHQKPMGMYPKSKRISRITNTTPSPPLGP
jgi:hypothetical protein